MYSRKILCHAHLPKRWKLEKHTPYWDINVQSINRLKNMVRHISRLKIDKQLDKTHSIVGLQCVTNEVIEENIAR